MCGTATTGCHGRAESRDSAMRDRGFHVLSWQVPADIPVRRWDGASVLLNPDGTITYT